MYVLFGVSDRGLFVDFFYSVFLVFYEMEYIQIVYRISQVIREWGLLLIFFFLILQKAYWYEDLLSFGTDK